MDTLRAFVFQQVNVGKSSELERLGHYLDFRCGSGAGQVALRDRMRDGLESGTGQGENQDWEDRD